MCMRIYIYIYSTKRTERHLNVKVYVDGKIKKKLKDINRGVDRKKKDKIGEHKERTQNPDIRYKTRAK